MSNPIGWTDQTWNPVTGCSAISPGCTNCYAKRMAHRLKGRYGYPDDMSEWSPERGGCMVRVDHSFDVTLHPNRLEEPLRWRKPRRVFVCSMSDLFHENVPDEFIGRVWDTMAISRWHHYQVLTKRPERAADVLPRLAARHTAPDGSCWPLPNVWLGVTAEDQQRADERIPILLDTPAAVRFVSCEPLLEAVDLARWLSIAWQCSGCRGYFPEPWQKICPHCGREDYWTGSHQFNPPGGQRGPGLDWVIAGGETGPGARPMRPDWVRSLRDQCQTAGVPFFFKGWGEWLSTDQGAEDRRDLLPETPEGQYLFYRVGKKAAGHLLDGVAYREFPTAP